MPFDGSVTKAVVDELKSRIINGKIEKIYQPEKDALILNIRSYNENTKLLLSASPNFPRLHITDDNYSNPITPPAFCMLLRKYLTGGKIISVNQPELERIVEITMDCFDELGYSAQKSLIIEIMGRHSNIIFMDKGTGKIIDSIKRIDITTSSVRQVLPGLLYENPPSADKKNPLILDKDDFIKSIKENTISLRADKYLIKTYNGISPAVAKEICANAGFCEEFYVNNCPIAAIESLFVSFSQYITKLAIGNFSPTIYYKEKAPFDFFCDKLSIYNNIDSTDFDSMSKAIELFYSEKDKKERITQKASDIHKIISNRLERCYKKLDMFNKDIVEALNAEEYKIKGDLLTSNSFSIEKGSKVAIVQNYYSANLENIEIDLDVQLNPIQNAQRYYKQYNKMKKALVSITGQIKENKTEMIYLESLLDNMHKCTEEQEINEIRHELAEQGYIKVKKETKKKHIKVSKPMHFVSSDGSDIYVGKNNLQNDFLTLKMAESFDIWLHTKEIPGSHVIIKTDNKPISDLTLEEAANLAAFYSKAKNSSKVPIDYAFKKYVKKPNGAKPGMVIYESNKTIYITPNEDRIKAMKHL